MKVIKFERNQLVWHFDVLKVFCLLAPIPIFSCSWFFVTQDDNILANIFEMEFFQKLKFPFQMCLLAPIPIFSCSWFCVTQDGKYFWNGILPKIKIPFSNALNVFRILSVEYEMCWERWFFKFCQKLKEYVLNCIERNLTWGQWLWHSWYHNYLQYQRTWVRMHS